MAYCENSIPISATAQPATNFVSALSLTNCCRPLLYSFHGVFDLMDTSLRAPYRDVIVVLIAEHRLRLGLISSRVKERERGKKLASLKPKIYQSIDQGIRTTERSEGKC